MINKRKKPRKQIADTIHINRRDSWESGSILDGVDETFGGPAVGAATKVASNLASSASQKVDGFIAKNLAIEQEKADLRAESEESNLDLLDRGARYVRKNKKLKEFKDAQAAKV